jgi:hypothetical protein
MGAWGTEAGSGCWGGFLCPASGACVGGPGRCPEGDPLRRGDSVYAAEVRWMCVCVRERERWRERERGGGGGGGGGA